MSSIQIDPVFGSALRAALLSRIERETSPKARRRRRMFIVLAALAGAGVITAGSVATASFLTTPGASQVVALSNPVSFAGSGTETVELGSRPAGATNISLELTCLTVGTFLFSDGAQMTCSATDLAQDARMRTADYSIPLQAGQHSTVISAPEGSRWTLIAMYTSEHLTAWAVNPKGETYGVQNGSGTPDLVAVVATNGLNGYVRATDLAKADGSDQHFTSPAQALAWQASRKGKSFAVPVYRSDGTTKIGEFVIDG